MSQKSIIRSYTLTSALYINFMVVVLALFGYFYAYAYDADRLPILLIMGIVLAALAGCDFIEYRKHKQIKRRQWKVKAFAKKIHAVYGTLEKSDIDKFSISTIDDKEGIRNPRFYNAVSADGWSYADFAYDIYRKNKYGEDKVSTEYYSVMMIQLPRKLPNIVFDSVASRKRQYRRVFSGSQRVSLEANFDNYFTAYMPKFYAVDVLSIITPEVMHALIDASDYDIEIKEDYLFLFGDLREPEIQIDQMSKNILAIKTKLMHNIITYRDQRVGFEVGREKVNTFAVALRKSMLNDTIYLIIFAVVAVVIPYTWITGGATGPDLILWPSICIFGFIIYAYYYIKEFLKYKREVKEFKKIDEASKFK